MGGDNLGMSGEVAGQAVNAVLAPSQAERFAGVADVDLGRLVLNVTGRNKLVLLDSDPKALAALRSSPGVHDLCVEPLTLEEAYCALLERKEDVS